MQTRLTESIRHTTDGRNADSILRKCVHCGFCTATCPTYQLLGDELDGPRGRIYLIKEMLEGAEVSARTQLHLDRCLTCRACETTCPSGVRYGQLVEIGRRFADRTVERGLRARALRAALRWWLPHRQRFGVPMRLGQAMRGFLPASLRARIPLPRAAGTSPPERHPRVMLTLGGCVQEAIAPSIDGATARVLDRLGVSLRAMPMTGCCGAVSLHLGAHEQALDTMRRNIDQWWPALEAGAEAIVVTASACALQVKEYAESLAHDPVYADKAARVSHSVRDVSEVVSGEDLDALGRPGEGRRVAFHSPCTLQHGQRLNGVVENVLQRLGFELTPVADAHLCCGSAGTYSVLQPAISKRLLDNKLSALGHGTPDVIATANIGCYAHLSTGATVPVRHWIELLDEDGDLT